MRPFGALVLAGAAAFLAGCGEGQFYDEIEARSCPEALPLDETLAILRRHGALREKE